MATRGCFPLNGKPAIWMDKTHLSPNRGNVVNKKIKKWTIVVPIGHNLRRSATGEMSCELIR